MKKITSFCVDHDHLEKGMYVSREDGDVITYDLRMVKPNQGGYLENAGLHTLEHLFATYVRNTEESDAIVYVGPMGCRTGFYLLTYGIADGDVLPMLRSAFAGALEFSEVPGSRREECGNYLEHDLEGAKRECAAYLAVLEAI